MTDASEIAALRARVAELESGIDAFLTLADRCRTIERGVGGMTVEAQAARTSLIDVKLLWVDVLRDVRWNTSPALPAQRDA